MEDLGLRREVFPGRRLRLRRLAEERAAHAADARVSAKARPPGFGMHVLGGHLRPARPADARGLRRVAESRAVLVLLLGLRSVLPELAPRAAGGDYAIHGNARLLPPPARRALARSTRCRGLCA